MKIFARITAVLLACMLSMTGCGLSQDEAKDVISETTAIASSAAEEASGTSDEASADTSAESHISSEAYTETSTTEAETISEATTAEATTAKAVTESASEVLADTADIPEFDGLDDENLLTYVEDSVYAELVTNLNSSDYLVHDVSSVYVSKEYLEELEYNSRKNIFFGYTLEEVENSFSDSKYVFTLGDDGTTIVKPFEDYDDTYEQVIKDVAIGTGVILVCVTVSAVTGGTAPAVSMIFAVSAKTAATCALSSGVLSGAAAAITTGITTHDVEKTLKAAALSAGENFKWGAISGAIAGGVSETLSLHGMTLNGLTMNEAAIIQKETQYPMDVISQFSNMDQYNICKEANLTADMVNGKTALIRNIDLTYVDEATGLTNLQRMQKGLAALDPATGKAYELHHIGQKADATLAILTQEEHRLGDSYKIWHELEGSSEIDRAAFDKIRKQFWKSLAEMMG